MSMFLTPDDLVLVVRSSIAVPMVNDFQEATTGSLQSHAEDHSIHETIQDANETVRRIFYEKNPYGWSEYELSHEEIDVEHDSSGLCTMSVYPLNCPWWEVCAFYTPKDSVNIKKATPAPPPHQVTRDNCQLPFSGAGLAAYQQNKVTNHNAHSQAAVLGNKAPSGVAGVLGGLMVKPPPLFVIEEHSANIGNFFLIWTNLTDRDSVLVRWEFYDGKRWKDAKGPLNIEHFTMTYRGSHRCLTPSPLFINKASERVMRVRAIIFDAAVNVIGSVEAPSSRAFEHLKRKDSGAILHHVDEGIKRLGDDVSQSAPVALHEPQTSNGDMRSNYLDSVPAIPPIHPATDSSESKEQVFGSDCGGAIDDEGYIQEKRIIQDNNIMQDRNIVIKAEGTEPEYILKPMRGDTDNAAISQDEKISEEVPNSIDYPNNIDNLKGTKRMRDGKPKPRRIRRRFDFEGKKRTLAHLIVHYKELY